MALTTSTSTARTASMLVPSNERTPHNSHTNPGGLVSNTSL